jgi:hypothetical protein
MIRFSLFLLTRAETRGENQNNLLSAQADSLRDKGTDEDRHKGTEEQRDRADGFFCFVPLHLCHFVPFFLCAYVPLPLCACIVVQEPN